MYDVILSCLFLKSSSQYNTIQLHAYNTITINIRYNTIQLQLLLRTIQLHKHTHTRIFSKMYRNVQKLGCRVVFIKYLSTIYGIVSSIG